MPGGQLHREGLPSRLPAALPDPVKARRHVEAGIVKRQREHVPDRNSPSGVRSRAIAISASEAMSPDTTAPRPAARFVAVDAAPGGKPEAHLLHSDPDRDGHPQPSRQLPDGERRGLVGSMRPHADSHARARKMSLLWVRTEPSEEMVTLPGPPAGGPLDVGSPTVPGAARISLPAAASSCAAQRRGSAVSTPATGQ